MDAALQTGQMALIALLAARPEKREELQQTLFSLLEGIQAQPGCLACMAGQDLGGEPRFHLHLVWRDREALEAFMVSEVFRILLGALQILAAATEFRMVSLEDTFSPVELNHGSIFREVKAIAPLPNPP